MSIQNWRLIEELRHSGDPAKPVLVELPSGNIAEVTGVDCRNGQYVLQVEVVPRVYHVVGTDQDGGEGKHYGPYDDYADAYTTASRLADYWHLNCTWEIITDDGEVIAQF